LRSVRYMRCAMARTRSSSVGGGISTSTPSEPDPLDLCSPGLTSVAIAWPPRGSARGRRGARRSGTRYRSAPLACPLRGRGDARRRGVRPPRRVRLRTDRRIQGSPPCGRWSIRRRGRHR
jgi:hypothetical protein